MAATMGRVSSAEDDRKELIMPKGKFGPFRKGSSRSSARPVTTTNRVKIPFAKKLVLVVWIPKYLRGNVGHAALKLKSTDENGDLQRIDYMSWWPEGEGKGMVTTRKGTRQSYWQDQYSELDKAVRIAIFVSYLYRAYMDIDRDDTPMLPEGTRTRTLGILLRNVWRKYADGSNVKKRWRGMGFSDDFGNMGELIAAGKVGMKPGRHRLKKGSDYAKPDGSFKYSFLETDGVGFSTDRRAEWAEVSAKEIGRYPDKKVYLPCAHLKTIEDAAGHLPVWGLSLDLLRLSWVIFRETRDPKWQMLTNKLNCASVVWNRMLEGFMDAFVTPKGSVSTLGTAVIDPNDVASIGESLRRALDRVNERQEQLFKLADDNFAAVRQVMTAHAIDQPGTWRKMLQLDFWKNLSGRKGHRRPQSLRKIDGIVARYERQRKRIRASEEQRVVEALLVDEKKFMDLKRQHAEARLKVQQIEANRPQDPKLGIAKRHLDIRDSQEETTRGYMMANFDYLKGPRVEMARELVRLQNAICACTRSLKANNPRRASVILLGLCVGWAFFEAAHLGEYIDFAAPQEDHSFLCVTGRQGIYYDGPIVQPTAKAQRALAEQMELILSNLELDEGAW